MYLYVHTSRSVQNFDAVHIAMVIVAPMQQQVNAVPVHNIHARSEMTGIQHKPRTIESNFSFYSKPLNWQHTLDYQNVKVIQSRCILFREQPTSLGT